MNKVQFCKNLANILYMYLMFSRLAEKHYLQVTLFVRSRQRQQNASGLGTITRNLANASVACENLCNTLRGGVVNA